MTMKLTRSLLVPTLVLSLVPGVCFAQSLNDWVGLFYIGAGIILTAGLLFYGAGMVVWVVRLNTFPTNRDYAIELLEWAVTILFVLIVLLAVVHYTQVNTRVVLIIIALLLVFFVGRAVVQSGGGGEEGEHGGH